jgi:hypothetical protein
MSAFIRRFLFDPGIETLLEIESVNILDLDPPASISGIGTGTALIVGEFENGDFAVDDGPSEVTGATDFLNRFGGFGYVYSGVGANNPSARARKADGALLPEFWNGNGFISLVNKRFRRLIIARVDTSVGEVSFTRLACLSGGNAPAFDLEPGQTIVTDSGGGPLIATFTGVVGTYASGAGVYPTLFVGGEQLVITVDQGTVNQIGPVTVTFLAADQSQAQVVARINAAMGFACAAVSGGGVTTFVGRQRGTGGNLVIVSASVAVLAALNIVAGTTAGTGNTSNIDAVTVAEANTIIGAANPDLDVDRDADGNIRICNVVDGGIGTLDITAASTATGFGFTIPSSADAAIGVAGVIPAGTRVRNVGGTEWVTMQDVAVADDSSGPYTAKVRPATDDGTTLAAAVATVNVFPFPISVGAFAVTNLLGLTAALTEAQLDAKYTEAIDTTRNLNNVGSETNVIWSSRQSNAIRNALLNNALLASSEGCLGRQCVVRPPLGTTTRATAQGTAQPGVGASRDQRLIYAYPGVQTFCSQMAARGTAGGDGFTANGVLDVPFDGFIASVISQLPPEENPGQQTAFLIGALGIEASNPDVQNLTIVDYTNFRSKGIAAPRIDGGAAFIQSGVTSVDPLVFPNLRNIARRRIADFIQDTLARRLKSFSKRLNSRSRRALITQEVRAFMQGLVDSGRIDGFLLDAISGNTPTTLAQGIFRLILKVRSLSSLDSIVLETTVGEGVDVAEAA